MTLSPATKKVLDMHAANKISWLKNIASAPINDLLDQLGWCAEDGTQAESPDTRAAAEEMAAVVDAIGTFRFGDRWTKMKEDGQ